MVWRSYYRPKQKDPNSIAALERLGKKELTDKKKFLEDAIEIIEKAFNLSDYKERKNSIPQKEISEENKKIIDKYNLIINCSPIGTYPKTTEIPNIPISLITNKHIVYDLIYNPVKSELLKQSEEKGAKVINGYQMLKIQAKESWKIWNTEIK